MAQSYCINVAVYIILISYIHLTTLAALQNQISNNHMIINELINLRILKTSLIFQ